MFLTMLKIGAITFGGGYAMIAVMQREFVEKKQWIGREEFLDLIAISESTPGPVAINSATYIGYKVGKVWGSLLATLGMCIPSFSIIYVISLFFDEFLSLEYVSYAFRGIQVGVSYLILTAGIKMIKALKKNVFNVSVLVATMVAMILFGIFAVRFSTIYYILIAGALGVFVYCLSGIIRSKKKKGDKVS